MKSDSRFIAIRGLSVHYRVVMPEGTVRHRVLLVPSPGQSEFNWRFVVPELIAAGCKCVIADLPGFGQSQMGEGVPQDHETRAKFLWGLLDALDLEEGRQLNCWHLMAHGSAAGTIAEMAVQQPDSAASLLMFAPVLYPPLRGPLGVLASRPFFEKLIRFWFRRNVLNQRRFSRMMTRLYGAPLRESALLRLHRPMLRLSGQEAMLRHALLEGCQADTSRLNDLFMPSMVIWGGRDTLLGGQVPAKLRGHDFRNAEYHVLKSAGHCPQETNGKAVCDFLRGWIREMWV